HHSILCNQKSSFVPLRCPHYYYSNLLCIALLYMWLGLFAINYYFAFSYTVRVPYHNTILHKFLSCSLPPLIYYKFMLALLNKKGGYKRYFAYNNILNIVTINRFLFP